MSRPVKERAEIRRTIAAAGLCVVLDIVAIVLAAANAPLSIGYLMGLAIISVGCGTAMAVCLVNLSNRGVIKWLR